MAMFAGLLSSFVGTATMAQILIRDLHRRRKFLVRLASIESRWALRAFNVEIDAEGFDHEAASGHLMVSNHLGYLDILVLSSLAPCAFVTSVEIKNTPFLGWLTELGGCLYVERRSRENLGLEISDIRNELDRGLNVCIFPEATSTNGEAVLRFRKPLYNAAIDSQKPVVPICLNYTTIDGENVTPKNRDLVFWYGDMDFLGHLWSFFGCDSVRVEVTADVPVCTRTMTCPQSLAEKTHSTVSARFRPVGATI